MDIFVKRIPGRGTSKSNSLRLCMLSLFKNNAQMV